MRLVKMHAIENSVLSDLLQPIMTWFFICLFFFSVLFFHRMCRFVSSAISCVLSKYGGLVIGVVWGVSTALC